MKKQPCVCCKDKKPGPTSGNNGYGYNRLKGEERKWAADHQVPKSEFCVPVKGGKKFGGPDWVRVKCGDGRMGFSTRRRNQNEVRIEVGLDGQFKNKRSSLVKRKSAASTATRKARRVDGSKCGLASSVAIQMASRDPIAVAEQKRV